MNDEPDFRPLLDDDDEPSWLDVSDDGGTGAVARSRESSPWDVLASAAANDNRGQRSGTSTRSSIAQSPSGDENNVNDDANLPRIVMFMRLGNVFAAVLLIVGSATSLMNIFSLPKMILGGYGICFGLLICCLEMNLSFLRIPIASNFGFLYSPTLRLGFYFLMAMVAWSFDTLLGMIAAGVLGVLSLMNTYVLCRYPGYGKVLMEVADEDEKRLRREGMRQMWKNRTSLPWWEV